MPVVKSKMPVLRRTAYQRPTQIKPTIGLRDFYDKRKKVLINRACGGLGDILMHRMMFEDFKRLLPNCELHFSCPRVYHDAVIDHPFLDKILDCATASYHDYIIHYNTTTACGRWEIKMAPMAGKHRSDIWADHCGMKLESHNMHIRISEEEQAEGRRIIEKHRDRPGKTVVLAPISTMTNKNLSDEVILAVSAELQKRGFYVFGLHIHPVYAMLKNNIPTIHSLKIRNWMSVIHQADYVISVDTSHFHAAGGMYKPTVGVFTFVSGPTYKMYYPTVELVQGPCPLHYRGCYDWGKCPKLKVLPKLPCCSGITPEAILAAFDRLVSKGSNNEAS